MITDADILAALDVVKQLTDEIDDLPPDVAIHMREAIDGLTKASKLCHELLQTRAVNSMDGQPIKIGTQVWVAKRSGKWRPQHPAIRKLLLDQALDEATDKTTGEINARQAALHAIALTYEAFVSPATNPKEGLLTKLGMERKQVAKWEAGKLELEVLDIGDEPDDDA